MKTNSNKLEMYVDKDLWIETQKHLAIVTGITTQLIDTQGLPITGYSVKNSFCEVTMNDQINGRLCRKCKSRGALEALQNNKPYIHLCPFELVEISIPIVVDNEYIGSIAGGQIRLLIPEAGAHLEHLVEPQNALDYINKPNINTLYNDLNKMSCTNIMAVTRLLVSISNYITKCSFELMTNSPGINKCQNITTYSPVNIASALPASNSFYNSVVPEKYASKNHLLQPVFNYIYAHKGENISLTDSACLCHLSSSYFSRLFTKEIGINYSLFLNQLKIEWTKELLETTELSIIEISCDLGFNDSTYFIKMFKRFEGITPARYRKKTLLHEG